jgi:hypothetical protein
MALVIGALPIAATSCINSPAKKFTTGLLQEQKPLMQDVDVIVWPLPLGHEQSEAFLHALGLIKSLGQKRTRRNVLKNYTVLPGALFFARACDL